jgi:hypothetical protein
MSPDYIVLVEMGLVLFVVLGWGFWELYKLKKDE